MRVLVIGGDGMLGHQLVHSMSVSHEVHATYRRSPASYGAISTYLARQAHFEVAAETFSTVLAVLDTVKPDAVVNCVGIIKQRSEAKDAVHSIVVNALFPHRLAEACDAIGARLVQMSTDCVFSGRRGGYKEDDITDSMDLYGRTKALGEVSSGGCVTLRTSIIGLELSRKASLVEWFLAQRGEVRGFRRAIFSGLTTLELSRVITEILERRGMDGLYHVAAQPISKFDLLSKLNGRLGNFVTVVPDDEFTCDRSLNGDVFRMRTGYVAPSWEHMLDELAVQIRERYS